MRIILLNEDKKIVEIKFGLNEDYINSPGLQPGEIVSDAGLYGQIMQADGSFITPEPTPVEPKPTLEEQIAKLQADNAQLKDDNITIMDVLGTMFEGMLDKGTV